MIRAALILLTLLAAPASARVVQAQGQWSAHEDKGQCRAMARSLRDAGKGQRQAFAAFLFDPARRQNGVLSVRLSRPVRQGGSVLLTIGKQPFMLRGAGQFAWSRGPAQEAAIIAAVRSSTRMRIEMRDLAGSRRSDWYFLDGAPTAIDAAAAECARVKKG